MSAKPLAKIQPAAPRATPAPTPPPDSADMLAFMRGARQKFIVGFQSTFESIERLLPKTETDQFSARSELHGLVHRLAGLAGSMGFPGVSEHASVLESILDDQPYQGRVPAARQALEAIRVAYTADLTTPPTWSLVTPAGKGTGLTVLVVDDDPDQRALLTACLMEGGHTPVVRNSGVGLLECARAEQPSVILLDVNMPGVDGFGTCQMLKSDPETCGIPVVFMSTQAALRDRLAGLSLGADDYLCKPVDLRELLLRLRLLGIRRDTQDADSGSSEGRTGPLKYETFLTKARAQLARAPGTIAIVRLPAYHADIAWNSLREDLRRRDVVGWYDRSHIAVLFPEMSAFEARDHLQQLVMRLPETIGKGMHVGIACSPMPTWAIETLLAEADEALTEARYVGEAVAVKGVERSNDNDKDQLTVVVADDDPEVSRILDAHMQAAGFRTVLAFDGEDALAAVEAHQPDALVLDLMLPKMTGFDVLQALKTSHGKRPRTLVLSGKSREHDVTRAFEIGADDYVTKPFSPPELLARISRLLR